MGAPFITVADVVVDASARFAEFVLRLNELSSTPIRIGYSAGKRAAGSTREPHSDNEAVTFAPGEIEKTISVPLTDGGSAEQAGAFGLNVFVPPGVGFVVGSTREQPGAVSAALLTVSDRAIDPAASGGRVPPDPWRTLST